MQYSTRFECCQRVPAAFSHSANTKCADPDFREVYPQHDPFKEPFLLSQPLLRRGPKDPDMKAERSTAARDLVGIALMAVLMSVCSWITIPFLVPFTMQTFAVFCSLLLLGGKKGTAAIGLYLCMGLAGLPVFSGFRGGIGHLIGPTGGYLLGFILSGVLYMLSEPLVRKRKSLRWIPLAAGLLVCYLAGTLWFVTFCGKDGVRYGFFHALTLCVFPYMIPDCLKLLLAVFVCGRVRLPGRFF